MDPFQTMLGWAHAVQVLSHNIGAEHLCRACVYVAAVQLLCNDGFFIATWVVSCMSCF